MNLFGPTKILNRWLEAGLFGFFLLYTSNYVMFQRNLVKHLFNRQIVILTTPGQNSLSIPVSNNMKFVISIPFCFFPFWYTILLRYIANSQLFVNYFIFNKLLEYIGDILTSPVTSLTHLVSSFRNGCWWSSYTFFFLNIL